MVVTFCFCFDASFFKSSCFCFCGNLESSKCWVLKFPGNALLFVATTQLDVKGMDERKPPWLGFESSARSKVRIFSRKEDRKDWFFF